MSRDEGMLGFIKPLSHSVALFSRALQVPLAILPWRGVRPGVARFFGRACHSGTSGMRQYPFPIDANGDYPLWRRLLSASSTAVHRVLSCVIC